MTRLLQGSIAFSIGLVALFCVGTFIPGALTWGFHFLAYLPSPYLWIYVVLAISGIVFFNSNAGYAAISNIASFMQASPYKFLGIAIAVFIAMAYSFRITDPLLGDGFFIINNFSEAYKGTSPLYLRNEPLSTYYFYLITALSGMTSYEAFLRAFWMADLFAGAGFIILVFFFSKSIIENEQARLLTFAFIASSSCMVLFFGYLEIYSFVLLSVGAFILVSALYLKKKLAFPWVALSFFIQCVSHYLTVLLLPAFLYLAYREWKQYGTKHIVTGATIIAAGILTLFWLVDFNPENLIASVPHSHVLSLFENTEPAEVYSSTYTLLSPFHLLDIVNLYVLLAPAAIFMIIYGILYHRSVAIQQPFALFLFLGFLPILAFTLVAKYDLGAAKDWDVVAPLSFILITLGSFFFLCDVSPAKLRAASIVLWITLLSSTTWFALNATTESAISRALSLFDKRNLSPLGHYGGSLHLAKYFRQTNDPHQALKVWEQYSKKFPHDRRGYLNIIQNIKIIDKANVEDVSNVYESWIRIDSLAFEGTLEYAKFCIETGNRFFEQDQLEQAMRYYSKANELNPGSAQPYNNIGSVYAVLNDKQNAVLYYKRAIALDSLYSDAYYNLGNVLLDSGEVTSAAYYMKKAAELGHPLTVEPGKTK